MERRADDEDSGQSGAVGRPLLWILGLAILTWVIWIAGVLLVAGWAGIEWIGLLPVGLVIVGAMLALVTVVAGGSPVPLWRRLAFGTMATAVFSVGLNCALPHFYPGPLGMLQLVSTLQVFESVLWWPITLYDVPGLVRSAITYGLAIVLLPLLFLIRQPRPFLTTVLVLFAHALVLPLSVLTVALLPAFDGSTNLVHAVKMGYPAFWAVAMTGLAVLAAVKLRTFSLRSIRWQPGRGGGRL